MSNKTLYHIPMMYADIVQAMLDEMRAELRLKDLEQRLWENIENLQGGW